MMSYKYRVLLVSTEDKDMLSKILESADDFEVAETAEDPTKALQILYRKNMDVLLLDMDSVLVSDALIYIKRIPDNIKITVILCGRAPLSAEAAQKLEKVGVKTFIRKPKKGNMDVTEFCLRIAVAVVGLNRDLLEKTADVSRKIAEAQKKFSENVIVIGSSTGGTVALEEIFTKLGRNLPGIIIVQHMAKGFTRDFARTLNQSTSIEVIEGEDGIQLFPGQAIIVPSDHALAITKRDSRLIMQITDRDLKSVYNPNIDYTMNSVAKIAGKDALGIILTGMGDDGARGLKALRDRGAHTIAQDETTSVVYGMPRKALEYGGVAEVLPLGKIAEAINRWVSKL